MKRRIFLQGLLGIPAMFGLKDMKSVRKVPMVMNKPLELDFIRNLTNQVTLLTPEQFEEAVIYVNIRGYEVLSSLEYGAELDCFLCSHASYVETNIDFFSLKVRLVNWDGYYKPSGFIWTPKEGFLNEYVPYQYLIFNKEEVD